MAITIPRCNMAGYFPRPCPEGTEHPVQRASAAANWDPRYRAIRRVGVRLSRAQDVVGCVAVPGHSPADSWLGCIFIHRRLRRELTILPLCGSAALSDRVVSAR